MKNIFFGLTIVALAGCANLNSIYRPIAIGSNQVAQAVTTDIKQRVILSAPKPRIVEKQIQSGVVDVVFCPEPSPESLSAYGNSAGVSGNRGTQASAQAALAASESAGYIGLRTQSIQLLRDDKFTICLGYLINAINSGEFYDLHRRSQNFTLGILAIEQLTGVVKADQIALGTSAGAGGGSDNIEKESAALDSARTEQNETVKNLDKARLELEILRSELKPIIDRVAVAQKNLANIPANADENTKNNAKDNLEKEANSLAAKKLEINHMEINVASLQRSVSNADAKVAASQSALGLALSRVRATASGIAAFNRSGGINTAVADHISNATVAIVKAVLAESGRGEQCNAVLASIRSNTQNINQEAAAQMVAVACPNVEIINAADNNPDTKNILNRAFQLQRKMIN